MIREVWICRHRTGVVSYQDFKNGALPPGLHTSANVWNLIPFRKICYKVVYDMQFQTIIVLFLIICMQRSTSMTLFVGGYIPQWFQCLHTHSFLNANKSHKILFLVLKLQIYLFRYLGNGSRLAQRNVFFATAVLRNSIPGHRFLTAIRWIILTYVPTTQK